MTEDELFEDVKHWKARAEALEAVLRDLPMYSDNWSWARENVEVLKTVPGMRFYQDLEIKLGWYKVEDEYRLVKGPNAPHWFT